MTAQSQSLSLDDAIHFTRIIVLDYIRGNAVPAEDLPQLLKTVFQTVYEFGEVEDNIARDPAVPITDSVTPDYIVCLEDGKKLKLLKRYLRTHYDLSPEEYRHRWGLPADYPMTAPNYGKRRSQIAKKIGLGTAETGGRRKAASKKRKRKRA